MKRKFSLITMLSLAMAVWTGFALAAPLHLSSITDKVKKPGRIAIDTQGNLYVSEPIQNKLQIFNHNGQLINSLSVPGVFAVAVDQVGRIYAGSEELKAVQVYNPDLTLSHSLGSGKGEFIRPNSIAVDGSGRVYVVDSRKNTVSVYEATGLLAFSFGGIGNTNGKFNTPLALAINDTAGEVFVTDRQRLADDTSGARVQVFNKDNGVFKRSFGTYGEAVGQITSPVDIAVDSRTGTLYVVDAFQNAALIMNPATGAISGALFDLTPGRQMATPQGICISKNGIVYITSYNGGSIERYALDGEVTMETSPPSLGFIGVQYGLNPIAREVSIANSGRAVLNWTVASNSVWLIPGQTTGSTGPASSAKLAVAVAPTALATLVPGTHTAALSITADFGRTDTIAVTLVVLPPPSMTLSNGWLTFTTKKNQAALPQTITVAIESAVALPWSAHSNAAWLGIAPSTGSATTTAAVSINTAGLAVGDYAGYITFSAPGAIGDGNRLTVNLSVKPGTKIAVTTNLESAAFTLAGPATYSGFGLNWSVEDAPAGEYGITYDAVPGYHKPSSQTLTLGASGELGFSGTYLSDAEPPALTLSTLADGSYTNNGTLNLAGTVTDNLVVAGVTVNGEDGIVNADGSFSLAVQLSVGTNVITTTATDTAGNTTIDTRTIILDQTALTLALSRPADNSVTNATEVMVEGTVDKTATVSVQVNGENTAPAIVTENAFSLPAALAYGQNTIQVTATDLAGNSGTIKRTVSFDNRNPMLAVTHPAQDITTNQPGLELQGTVEDLTGTTVTITVDETTYTPEVTNGAFRQRLVFTAAKTYAVIVTAADAAGNTTTVQRNIIAGSALLSVSPASLSFGNQLIRTASAARTVTVRNTGAAPVRIKNIRIRGKNQRQFMQTNDCPATLAAGASCTVSVIFRPTLARPEMSAELMVNVIEPATSRSLTLTGAGMRK